MTSFQNKTCQQNADCHPYESNRLCYFDQELEMGLCKCNAYLAWTGPNCEQLSTASHVSIAWMSIVATLCYIMVLIMIFIIHTSWKRSGETTCERLQHGRIMSSGLFLMFSFWLGVWATLRALGSSTTSGEPVFSVKDNMGDAPANEYGYYSRFEDIQDFLAITLTGIFGVLAVTNVAVVWIRTAENVNKLNIEPDDSYKYSKAIRVMQGFFVLAMIVSNILDRLYLNLQSIIGFILFAFSVMLIFLYAYGSMEFIKILLRAEKNCSSEKSKAKIQFRNTRNNVNTTSKVMIFGLILHSTSWLSYSLMDTLYGINHFGRSEEPSFVLPALAEHLTITGALILVYGGGISLLRYTAPNLGSEIRKALARRTTIVVESLIGSRLSKEIGDLEKLEKLAIAEQRAKEAAQNWSVELQNSEFEEEHI